MHMEDDKAYRGNIKIIIGIFAISFIIHTIKFNNQPV